MSMFLCPLCGKQSSIKLYHPETFEDDVEIFHNVGLGYRKGFEKILGFSLEEFPELRDQLGNRARRVSEFLSPLPMTDAKIVELEKQLDEEKKKRIEADEQYEELDLGFLLNKLGESLGWIYSDVHAAVDDLIAKNKSLSQSNQSLSLVNQNHESKRLKIEQEKRNIESEKNRLKDENNQLRENSQKWAEAYRNLEVRHKGQEAVHNNALTIEQNRRIQVVEYLEELDLEVLLQKIREGTQFNFTDLHAGVDELIRMNSELEDERKEVLEFINNVLPEEHDIYYDLEEAISALYQFYEDQVEEGSDE
jgi:flagellar biosynthesis GTPase FlhF